MYLLRNMFRDVEELVFVLFSPGASAQLHIYPLCILGFFAGIYSLLIHPCAGKIMVLLSLRTLRYFF